MEGGASWVERRHTCVRSDNAVTSITFFGALHILRTTESCACLCTHLRVKMAKGKSVSVARWNISKRNIPS